MLGRRLLDSVKITQLILEVCLDACSNTLSLFFPHNMHIVIDRILIDVMLTEILNIKAKLVNRL